ncbi:MAG TPA: outer membrane beta-barrel protein [Myxococcales bacterium]|nr:outer membrane beta-barrel protein [Myxococcales bacterium]
MKKATIALAALFCVSASARAESSRRSTRIDSPTPQQKFLVGVDGDFGLPLGNYSDVNGVGGGLMLTGEYPMMPELSLTGRVGFQYHSDKDLGLGVSGHVHSIPFLLGAKYYFMPERQGFFGAAELGLFDLIAGASSGGVSASDSQVKLGVGVGVGYQMKQWNARVNLHSQSVGSFGDSMMVTAGVGYQFAGF